MLKKAKIRIFNGRPYFYASLWSPHCAHHAKLKGFAYPEFTEMEDVVFQHDSTPARWGLHLQESLDQHFPGHIYYGTSEAQVWHQ